MRRLAAALLVLATSGAGGASRFSALAAAAGGTDPAYVKGADLDLLEAVRRIAQKLEALTGRRLGNVIAVRADPDALRSSPPRRRVLPAPASRLAARGRAWEDLGLGGEAAIRAVLETLEADLPGLAIAGQPPRLLVGPDLLRGSRLEPAGEQEAESAVLHATGTTPDEVVVAHALVHLLQLREERSGEGETDTTDRLLARAAWEEGEATLVALLHLFGGLGLQGELLRGRLDPAEVFGGRLLPALPRAAPAASRALLDFVYREGFYRAAEVVRAEGIGALAEVSRRRPVTRDLLHTDRPPIGSSASGGDPSPPAAGLVLADRDEIGEQGIVTLVSSLAGKDDVALVAGDGWTGDTLWRWEPAGRDAAAASAGVTVWSTRWASRADAEEFAYAWRRCVEARLPGAEFAAAGDGALEVEAGDRRYRWWLDAERVSITVAPRAAPRAPGP